MRTGLLWYDPDPKKPAQTKIDEAAARYHERFGIAPNACHVNPEQPAVHPRLHVVANRWVRPFTFWVGVDEEFAAPSAAPARRPKAAAGAKRSA